ncbi:MAG: hypothetical protein ABIJ47_13705 [Candidatus Bathyarchaeota archaeon]
MPKTPKVFPDGSRSAPRPAPRYNRKSNSTLIILLIVVGVGFVLYASDPTSFMSTIGGLTERFSSEANETSQEIGKITKDIIKPVNEYGDYYFGLVKGPDGVTSNSYGRFVVLINNKDAVDPTYSQLVDFLKTDKTDEYPYVRVVTTSGSYYGSAESNVDISYLEAIINGTKQPDPPRICADFAETLHNNAERAGFRCAYVSIKLSGYSDPYNYSISSDTGHALVAFNTTDKGLIYIDSTGVPSAIRSPSNCDKIIDLMEISSSYTPRSLFPQKGWDSIWQSMGTLTGIYLTWDGDWK